MIEPSPTARRTTNAAHAITPVDNKATERYELHHRARKEKPKCSVCGCRVRARKVLDAKPKCDPCTNFAAEYAERKRAHSETMKRAALEGHRKRKAREARSKEKAFSPQKLYAARTQRGLTQKVLAQRAGTDHRNLRRWEKGEKKPQPATVAKLALALGVEIDELRGSE